MDLFTYFNKVSKDYDLLSKNLDWHSHEYLFGLMYEYVKEDEKLLDLGIGTGLSSELFNKAGLKIYGIDGSSEMLKQCASKQITDELKFMDFTISDKLPFYNDSFDYVIANGLFYFFEDLTPLFRNVKQVIKKKGKFGFTTEAISNSYIETGAFCVKSRKIKKLNDKVYQHSQKYLENLMSTFDFKILKQGKFLAYYDPTETFDVYFNAFVLESS
jgi:ubiquinone/menaquinone biosynthesis C-methylase UbiE